MKQFRTHKTFAFLLGLLVLLATGCIKEDLDECFRLTLKAVDDLGGDITDKGIVTEARLFVYDADGKLLESRLLDDAFIRGRQAIEFDYPENKKLHLVAWGNAKGKQDLSDGKTSDELAAILRMDANNVAQHPDSLFLGSLDVAVRGTGVAGGNQEIVIHPKTGTVEMKTRGLHYALKGAARPEECDYYIGPFPHQLSHPKGFHGEEAYHNPAGCWREGEWETTVPHTIFVSQDLTGYLQVGGQRYEAKEGIYEDGTTGPIEIFPYRRTLVLFEWGDDGAFLGIKIKVTPWGVVDDEINW